MSPAKSRNYKRLFLKWVSALVIVPIILSLAFVLYIHFSSKRYVEISSEKAPFDVAIVPGVPYDGVAWSKIMRLRVLWAKHLFDTGKVKNLIFSGSAVYTPYVESEVMAAYAKALNIPDSVIFMEKRAEHSTENMYFSLKMADSLDFETIVVTTDAAQSKLLSSFESIHENRVDFWPVRYGDRSKIEWSDPAVDCSDLRISNFEALPDREDFFTRFQGTLGRRVEELKKQAEQK